MDNIINKIQVNGQTYNLPSSDISSVVGLTGDVTAAQIASALSTAGYNLSGGTTYSAGTGITITGTDNAINVAYGTAAGTACQGNDSRLSNSRPASDVSSWAKASSKPSYAYSEIGYTVATQSTSGAVTINGTTPVHVITCKGNVSSVTLSANPSDGHSCHVFFFATAARTVAIAHDATNRVCPEAKPLSLSIPANGYVEVDFLKANGKVYVRGV